MCLGLDLGLELGYRVKIGVGRVRACVRVGLGLEYRVNTCF